MILREMVAGQIYFTVPWALTKDESDAKVICARFTCFDSPVPAEQYVVAVRLNEDQSVSYDDSVSGGSGEDVLAPDKIGAHWAATKEILI